MRKSPGLVDLMHNLKLNRARDLCTVFKSYANHLNQLNADGGDNVRDEGNDHDASRSDADGSGQLISEMIMELVSKMHHITKYSQASYSLSSYPGQVRHRLSRSLPSVAGYNEPQPGNYGYVSEMADCPAEPVLDPSLSSLSLTVLCSIGGLRRKTHLYYDD